MQMLLLNIALHSACIHSLNLPFSGKHLTQLNTQPTRVQYFSMLHVLESDSVL